MADCQVKCNTYQEINSMGSEHQKPLDKNQNTHNIVVSKGNLANIAET